MGFVGGSTADVFAAWPGLPSKVCFSLCRLMFDCWRLILCQKTGSDDASSSRGSHEAEEEDSDPRVDVPDVIRLVPDPPEGPPPPAGRASCLLGIRMGDQHPRSRRQLPGAPGPPAYAGRLGPGLWVRRQSSHLPICLPGSEAEAGSGELSGSRLGLEPRAPLYQVFKLNHIIKQSNCL